MNSPCEHCNCTGNRCGGQFPGIKLEWPELIGVNEKVAKATIEKDNPNVFVMILYPWIYYTPDICCNRVILFVDHPNGKVTKLPLVG